jgi:hypothetical protein
MPSPSSQDGTSFQNITPIPPKSVAMDYELLGTPPENPPANPSTDQTSAQLIGPSIMELGESSPVSLAVPATFQLYVSETAPNNSIGSSGDWYFWTANEDSVIIFKKEDCLWVQKASIPGADVTDCPDGCPVGGDLDGNLPDPSVIAIQGVQVNPLAPSSGQVLTATAANTAEWQDLLIDVPDASTSVKGITKLSVAPISASDPIAVGDNDPRNSDARFPTGAAGGDLSGLYPNPNVFELHGNGTYGDVDIEDGFISISSSPQTTNIYAGSMGMNNSVTTNDVAVGVDQIVISNISDGTSVLMTPAGTITVTGATGSWNFYSDGCEWVGVGGSEFFVNPDGVNFLYNGGGASGQFFVRPGSGGDGFNFRSGSTGNEWSFDPSELTENMGIKEIDVCVSGVAMKMLIMASDPYV